MTPNDRYSHWEKLLRDKKYAQLRKQLLFWVNKDDSPEEAAYIRGRVDAYKDIQKHAKKRWKVKA